MNWDTLRTEAAQRHFALLGGFYPNGDEDVPDGCRTLLMLGPDEPAFWTAFRKSPEYTDGTPHPMDRWSARVIGDWAATLGAVALYPFGGPPYLPFYTWALRTGRAHASPIGFLVHDSAGLFVSFRGALALPDHVDLPASPPSPCASCPDQPCRTACPVDALTDGGYDVPACKAYLDTPAGADCMNRGCAVRRACPVSQTFGRLPDQSAYHMRHFKGK